MKFSTLLLVAGAIALPLSAPAAQTIKDDVRDAWDTTKHAASRTGEAVEDGAVKTGRFVERGVQKTGNFIGRGLEPISDRLRGTPRVTLNEDRIAAPGTIPSGSDLVVRNTGDTGERFEIKGHGMTDKAFVARGKSKRLDLDLPRGNYTIQTADGSSTSLRVR